MKIRKISIQNLNSLRIKTSIDLCAPPLSNVGLFAITGDTGAGKTTPERQPSRPTRRARLCGHKQLVAFRSSTSNLATAQ